MGKKLSFKEIKKGMSYYSKAIRFMNQHKLWYFMLIPLFINVLLLLSGGFAVSSFTDSLQEYASGLFSLKDSEYAFIRFLDKIIYGFLWLFIRVIFMTIFLFIGGYVVLIVMSPFFAMLSEIVEKKITKKDFPFNLSQFFKDIWRGLRLATRNMLIEIGIAFIVFILSFIPLVGWIGAIYLFFVSSYFYGFSFTDYTMERHKVNFSQSISFMRKNKGLVIGNGMVFAFCLFIPWVGLTLSSFVSIISVVAATLAISDRVNTENLDGKEKAILPA